MSSWYAAIADHYADLSGHVSEAEFKQHMLERKDILATQKHILFSEWDKTMLARAESGFGISNAHYLHPKEMFQVFAEMWGDWGSRNNYGMLRYARMRKPEKDNKAQFKLPDRYVLCRFYSSKCFKVDEESIAQIRDLLDMLSREIHVVMLAPGFDLDDHSDIRITSANITVIDKLPFADNLAIQTALVANAELFVSTYGGLSYLGPLVNVPTLALYTNEKFLPSHLETMLRTARALNQNAKSAADRAEYLATGVDSINLIKRFTSSNAG